MRRMLPASRRALGGMLIDNKMVDKTNISIILHVTLSFSELKSRFSPLCCCCVRNAIRKGQVRLSSWSESWNFVRCLFSSDVEASSHLVYLLSDACASCKERKWKKCKGVFKKKTLSSSCVCGLAEKEHQVGNFRDDSNHIQVSYTNTSLQEPVELQSSKSTIFNSQRSRHSAHYAPSLVSHLILS